MLVADIAPRPEEVMEMGIAGGYPIEDHLEM